MGLWFLLRKTISPAMCLIREIVKIYASTWRKFKKNMKFSKWKFTPKKNLKPNHANIFELKNVEIVN